MWGRRSSWVGILGVSGTVGMLGLMGPPGCYAGRDGGAAQGGATGREEGDGEGGESGDDADDATGEPAELGCEEIGAQPLRRVSSGQYAAILGDLLPPDFAEQAVLASTFPATQIEQGFSTFASANTVSTGESIAIEDNAEAIAQILFDDRAALIPQLMPCVSAGYMPSEIDACIDDFIAAFGARAFRRPLTDAERSIVGELYAGVAADDGSEAGLTAVVQYFLGAPALLYATERGLPTDDSFAALDSWELAARLALFLRNAGPDPELVAAVQEGRLVTRDDVEREARRLIDGPAAIAVVSTFHREWMGAFSLESAVREHPQWSPEVQAAMLHEVDRFTEWFLAETDGTFETLMTTDTFPVDAGLAAIYGVDADAGAVPHRSGLLTLASVMSAQAHGDRTSLIERGAFVRNHVLCVPTPPFPGDIDPEATLGGHSDLPTARERYQPLMDVPQCAGCHMHINPFGFAFEAYDWAGAHRTTENGAPIDTSFTLEFGELSGDFADATELLGAIAKSEDAQACYATHAFRYALGRMDTPADECTLQSIHDAFIASGGDVRELMVAITTSDAFMFRAVGGAQ